MGIVLSGLRRAAPAGTGNRVLRTGKWQELEESPKEGRDVRGGGCPCGSSRTQAVGARPLLLMCVWVLLGSGQVLTPGRCPAGRRGWAELPCFPTQEGEAHRRGE